MPANSAVDEGLNEGPALEVNGAVATITLQRPGFANRIEREDLAAIRSHVARVNALDRVTVLRITATGKNFCSGYNLVSLEEALGGDADDFGVMVDEIENARPVTIAAINGGVYGGATDLCLSCDFRIGVPEAKLQMPALKLGVHLYGSGLERYVSRLGIDAAKRMLLTCEKIDSSTMLQLGFLTSIAPADGLHASVDKLTAVLGAMSPGAMLSVKKHLNRIARGVLSPQDLAADIQRVRDSADSREGLLSWVEARPPVYTGN